MSRRLAIATWLLTASATSVALAGSPASGQAQALARDARKLIAKRQYAAACPKLQESQRLAPSPKTLLELALCHEKEGKTATAFAELNTVVQQAEWEGPKEAAKTAKAHLLQLDPRLSRITVKVPASSETEGLQVTVDGLPLARSAWGLPQPVDPGRHEIAASGPGRTPWSTTIRIQGDREQQSVQVPVSVAPTAGQTPETIAQKEARAEDPNYGEEHVAKDEDTPSKKGKKPVLAYVVAGGGIAALGLGTYFGVRAIQHRKDSDSYCTRGCSQKGVDLNDEAKTAAWISNVSVGLGLAGVGVGVYLLLKSPPADADKPAEPETTSVHVLPEVSPSTAGLAVRGAW
jgi:hypothetical protein